MTQPAQTDKPTFQIEKGVPRPAKRQRTVYPFREMEIGDSFFVSGENSERSRLINAASWFGTRNGVKLSVRKVDGGARVWRIA